MRARKEVFIMENRRKRPEAEFHYITEFAFTVKELGRVLSRKGEILGEFTDELYDLGHMIVVFGISGPRGRIE